MKSFCPRLTVGLRIFFITLLVFGPAISQSAERDEKLAYLELKRKRVIAADCKTESGFWEICFEGNGIPGLFSAPHTWWDNPVDDDWESSVIRQTSWIVNSTGEGSGPSMRVDRSQSRDAHKTGAFWRRDEYLSSTTGVQAEFRFRLLSSSHEKSVMFHFFDDKSRFALVFSQHGFSFVPGIRASSPGEQWFASDNTRWNTFRLEKRPDSLEVKVWINGVALAGKPLLALNSSPIVPGGMYTAPRIGFGDPSNYCSAADFPDNPSCNDSLTTAGAYEIRFLRYGRFIENKVTPRTAWRRKPWPLPAAASCADNSQWEGMYIPKTRRASVTEPIGMGKSKGVTLEWIAKLVPSANSQLNNERLSVEFYDFFGGTAVTIHPNRIEVGLGGKPGGKAIALPNGFNPYQQNTYRIVRDELHGMYIYIYLNDDPIPLIADARVSGFSVSKPVIRFGDYWIPNYGGLPAESDYQYLTPTPSAIVSQIRWTNRAVAPGECNI